MTRVAARPSLAPGPHAAGLLGAALGAGLAAFLAPGRLVPWSAALGGTFSSLVLAHFAWATNRAARARLSRGQASQGRVRESAAEGSRGVFEFPAGGTEPWAADAFILFVLTLAVGWAGVAFATETRIPAVLLAILLAVVGLRASSIRSDRVRLELTARGWSVEAFVFGRPVRRSGPGAVLPELLPDGLVLWSEDGRIGVLRGELEPEERAWLNSRLLEHVPDPSRPEPASDQVEQAKTQGDRQEAESEHHA